MKVEINIKKEVDIKTIQVKAGVLYWEDSEINGLPDTEDGDNVPCKKGGLWMPEIEIETGKIINWTQGTTALIHYKVCDQCGWELKDESGTVVISADAEYVPDTLCPADNGYGDYIIMAIDENGMIEDWKFNISDFEEIE